MLVLLRYAAGFWGLLITFQHTAFAGPEFVFETTRELLLYVQKDKCRSWTQGCSKCMQDPHGGHSSCTLPSMEEECYNSPTYYTCHQTMEQWYASNNYPASDCRVISESIKYSCSDHPDIGSFHSTKETYEFRLYDILDSGKAPREIFEEFNRTLSEFRGEIANVVKKCREMRNHCISACKGSEAQSRMPASEIGAGIQKCKAEAKKVENPKFMQWEYFSHWHKINKKLYEALKQE